VAVALITGASTGIGRATALRLARSGWTVLAGLRDPEAGERLAQEPGAAGRIAPLTLDVTDPAQIEQAALRVAQASGGAAGLDALVNNAGIGVGGPLELVAAETCAGSSR
jgi:NAD(P)-dependent dehydrogenase (short-subunit alcohol dehydrogenase family)